MDTLKTKTKMEKKLKQVIEGQGFICETLEEKKRIWQKLTDAGYRMTTTWEDCAKEVFGIKWFGGTFGSIECEYITDPLNESDFFDEWTPKAGEWVEAKVVSRFEEATFISNWMNGFAVELEDGRLWKSLEIRQIKPETMTLQEVREALGKPNLIITQ